MGGCYKLVNVIRSPFRVWLLWYCHWHVAKHAAVSGTGGDRPGLPPGAPQTPHWFLDAPQGLEALWPYLTQRKKPQARSLVTRAACRGVGATCHQALVRNKALVTPPPPVNDSHLAVDLRNQWGAPEEPVGVWAWGVVLVPSP